MNIQTIDQLPHIKAALEEVVKEIKDKVPKSVQPETIEYEITNEKITIRFVLDVVASSIIFGTGPMNVHDPKPRKAPPIKPIYEWLGRAGLKQEYGFAVYIKKRIAGEIENRIGGTKPHEYYYNDAVNEILAKYEPVIQQAFEQDLLIMMGLENDPLFTK